MFSWNCRGCSKAILSVDVVNKTNEWMSWAVALIPKSSTRYMGSYDGYGTVGDTNVTEMGEVDYEPCLWHRACWAHSGMPKYDKPSDKADDATRFFDIDNIYTEEKEPK